MTCAEISGYLIFFYHFLLAFYSCICYIIYVITETQIETQIVAPGKEQNDMEFVQLVDACDRVRYIPVEQWESFCQLHNKEGCMVLGIVSDSGSTIRVVPKDPLMNLSRETEEILGMVA